MLVVAMLVAGSVSAGASTGREPVASVPYRLDYGGLLVVELMVGGEGPYDFIIDTGATSTSLFANLAMRHAFSPSALEPRELIGLSMQATMQPYTVGDITIAGKPALPDHAAMVLPDWKAPRKTPQGILGLDFLVRYILVFNEPDKRMELYDRAKPPKKLWRKWRKVKLVGENFDRSAGQLFLISGYIQGTRASLIFDTGSTDTQINTPTLQKLGKALLSERARRRGIRRFPDKIVDIFDEEADINAVIVGKVRAGNAVWRNPTLAVFDPSIFMKLGVADQPYGLFGMDRLARSSFAIDLGRRNLFIHRPK